MRSVPPADLVTWLRAAGEPSRLRLLALCLGGALSVTDLAQALRQSEPRVSRHLRILCEAGLLERTRQGQWVCYGVAEEAAAATFVRGLLAQIDRRDPLLLRDRAEASAVSVPASPSAASQSRLSRSLAEFVDASGLGTGLNAALVVGVAHPELLARAAGAAHHLTAIAHSRRAAQGARAFAERHGLACRVLLSAGAGALSDADLARIGRPFDAVLLDHLAGGEALVAQQLEQAQRVLAPHGRLWIFERYESLESAGERVVEHPLARLRRQLGEAGFMCERLSPIEADGEHVLAAAARHSAAGAAPGESHATAGGRR
ncbi:MAG: metalloregulator ArsR/SmtB family transcription factor [Steroidobacteraceae bacterium]